MANFTIVTMPSGIMRIHKAGCADIKREEMRSFVDSGWTVEGPDVDAVVTSQLEAFHHQDQQFTENDFSVAPCCRR